MVEVDLPLLTDELFEHPWIRSEAYILKSMEELNSQLKAGKSHLNSNDVVQFVKEYGHMFVSYVRYKGVLDPSWFKASFQLILDALIKFKHQLSMIFDEETLDLNECFLYRNSLRVLVFLLSKLSCARQRLLQGEKRLNALNILMRKDKPHTKDKNPDMTINALITLNAILSENIKLLWIDEPVDTSFLSVLVLPFLQEFEKGTFTKNNTFNKLFVSTMDTLCAKYQYCTEICTRLAQTLKHEDSCPLIVAECVRVISHSNTEYLQLIIDKIVDLRFEHSKKAGTTFYKNFASFINDIAHTMPNELLNSMYLVLDFLTVESYQARGAVLNAMCTLLETCLKRSELSNEENVMRELFFDAIVNQLTDSNLFLRSQMLQCIKRLADAKAIPITKQIMVLKRAVKLLKDSSSLVRKHSLGLIFTFASTNRFTKDFNKEKWKGLYDKVAEESASISVSTSDQTVNFDIDNTVGRVDDNIQQGRPVILSFVKDTFEFVNTFLSVIPYAAIMLRSKLQSDIIAALDFLVKCARDLSVDSARKAVDDCLHLVWHPERSVRDSLINTFVTLHLDSNTLNSDASVDRLLSSLESINRSGLLSVEVIFNELIERKLIGDGLNKKLLAIVKQADASPKLKQNALILLHLLNWRRTVWIKSNIEDIVNYGIVNNDKYVVIAETYRLITNIGFSNRNPIPDILPSDNIIFTAGLQILAKSFETSPVNQWCILASQFLSAICGLAQDPVYLIEILIKNLCSKLHDSNTDECSASEIRMIPIHQLIKICSFFGMVAISVLHFTEGRYVNNLKQQNRGVPEINKEDIANSLFTSNPQGGDSFEQFGDDADDLKMVARNILDTEIFASDTLLTYGLILVKQIIDERKDSFDNSQLQCAAHLALIRIVMISVVKLEAHLEFIFQSIDDVNGVMSSECKASMIMILGDLVVRYPNVMEPWNNKIYKLLRSTSEIVRVSALRVIARLVLREMIKVRGQISEVAVCVIDINKRIRNLSRYFFEELARRSGGSAIYNVFADVLSRLSDTEQGIDHEDKQRENLVDRLCHRFRLS
ncbi:hypothetical protein GJ496_003192, partial [Pomphorhynchus laevis]